MDARVRGSREFIGTGQAGHAKRRSLRSTMADKRFDDAVMVPWESMRSLASQRATEQRRRVRQRRVQRLTLQRVMRATDRRYPCPALRSTWLRTRWARWRGTEPRLQSMQPVAGRSSADTNRAARVESRTYPRSDAGDGGLPSRNRRIGETVEHPSRRQGVQTEPPRIPLQHAFHRHHCDLDGATS